MIENATNKKLRAGELALGFGVQHLRSAATPMIAAATGHDWLFIDMEHGAFSLQEATQICLAALPTGVTPIVRVTAATLDDGARALDNGAMGVIVAHVEDAIEARRIVQAYRYPPHGKRSWGGPCAPYRFKPPGAAEAQDAINDAILLVAMIESPEAVRNADEIAAVAGIDVLLIGTSDLSAELGVAGQISHPLVQDAYQTVMAACSAHGKTLGMGGVYDETTAAAYIRLGARMVLTGSDHSYLMAGAQARTTVLRGI